MAVGALSKPIICPFKLGDGSYADFKNNLKKKTSK